MKIRIIKIIYEQCATEDFWNKINQKTRETFQNKHIYSVAISKKLQKLSWQLHHKKKGNKSSYTIRIGIQFWSIINLILISNYI